MACLTRFLSRTRSFPYPFLAKGEFAPISEYAPEDHLPLAPVSILRVKGLFVSIFRRNSP